MARKNSGFKSDVNPRFMITNHEYRDAEIRITLLNPRTLEDEVMVKKATEAEWVEMQADLERKGWIKS